jgi:tRNA(Ile)-lysidine synthase
MGPPPPVAAVRLAVRRGLADLSAGGTVLVACSGGADSLALAAATAFEAPRSGLRAGAATVDHGLQPGSADRALAVAATLRRLGFAPVEILSVTVGRVGGPEAAARDARYAALADCADRVAAAAVLLGHSLDDQAETVLLGLARGSGARSLAGMAPVSGPGGRWRRPLLGLDRATLRTACAAEGLDPWEDPHNSDPAYARARTRAEALPALERSLGPGVAAALARTARLLRDDADALDAWAARALTACADVDGRLAVAALGELPPAVRHRVLRSAAVTAGAAAGSLTARHVGELERLVTDWHGQGPLHLPGGVRACRRYDRLLIAVEEPPQATRPQPESDSQFRE